MTLAPLLVISKVTLPAAAVLTETLHAVSEASTLIGPCGRAGLGRVAAAALAVARGERHQRGGAGHQGQRGSVGLAHGHSFGAAAAAGSRRGLLAGLEEQGQHDDDVGDPRDGLQHGRRLRVVEDALEQGAVPGRLRQHVRRVEGEGVDAGQERGLLEVVQAVAEHAGGDEHQQHAGDREELREVEPDGAAVEQPGQHDRGEDADGEADQRLRGVRLRGLDGGVEEHGGFEALAADGEERQQQHGHRADVQRVVHLPAQLGGDALGRLAHPEDHRRDEHDGDDRQAPAEQLLVLERELGGRVGQDRADGDRQQHRRADAGPHPAQRVTSLGLDQEGHEDADDERSLQAFA